MSHAAWAMRHALFSWCSVFSHGKRGEGAAKRTILLLFLFMNCKSHKLTGGPLSSNKLDDILKVFHELE